MQSRTRLFVTLKQEHSDMFFRMIHDYYYKNDLCYAGRGQHTRPLGCCWKNLNRSTAGSIDSYVGNYYNYLLSD